MVGKKCAHLQHWPRPVASFASHHLQSKRIFSHTITTMITSIYAQHLVCIETSTPPTHPIRNFLVRATHHYPLPLYKYIYMCTSLPILSFRVTLNPN